MKFTDSTKEQLKKIIRDLDYEACEYEWGSKEHECLMDIATDIENAIWGFERWKNQLFLLLKIV